MQCTSKQKIPEYRLHKSSGLGTVRIQGRDIYLGTYGTPESHARYRQVIGEWLAGGRHGSTPGSGRGHKSDLTVDELILAYVAFAKRYYVKNGQPTGELLNIKCALKPLAELYGITRIGEFGPVALKTVRQRMIELNLCRGVVNSRVNRIRRMFKWAVENEMVEATVLHGLRAVAPLKLGRCEVREAEPIRPASDEIVAPVLKLVPRQIAAMIQLQRLTGMRPNEITSMRPCDIDRSGPIWEYKPRSHKTEHHGRSRVIFLGPQAQRIAKPFLQRDPGLFMFSPREVVDEKNCELRQKRKTPLTPSQRARTRKLRPKKAPGPRYTTQSYGAVIARACKIAFPPPAALPPEQIKIWHRNHRWSPNQLRHTAATCLRKQFGIEAARVVLGHASAGITEVYAEADLTKAADIMGQVG